MYARIGLIREIKGKNIGIVAISGYLSLKTKQADQPRAKSFRRIVSVALTKRFTHGTKINVYSKGARRWRVGGVIAIRMREIIERLWRARVESSVSLSVRGKRKLNGAWRDRVSNGRAVARARARRDATRIQSRVSAEEEEKKTSQYGHLEEKIAHLTTGGEMPISAGSRLTSVVPFGSYVTTSLGWPWFEGNARLASPRLISPYLVLPRLARCCLSLEVIVATERQQESRRESTRRAGHGHSGWQLVVGPGQATDHAGAASRGDQFSEDQGAPTDAQGWFVWFWHVFRLILKFLSFAVDVFKNGRFTRGLESWSRFERREEGVHATRVCSSPRRGTTVPFVPLTRVISRSIILYEGKTSKTSLAMVLSLLFAFVWGTFIFGKLFFRVRVVFVHASFHSLHCLILYNEWKAKKNRFQ